MFLLQIVLLLLFFRIWNGNQTDLLTRTYLLFGLPKVTSFQSFFTIFLIFSDYFKSILKLRYWKNSLKGRRRINRRKGGPLSGNLDCKGKMFVNFCCYLCLSCFSFNFCNFFLNSLYNFSTTLSFALILETNPNKNLFEENKNEESLYCLLPFETHSPHFMKWCFTFRFKVNILMICPFFWFFDTYHLLFKFILILTWAIVNACWLGNFVDVALNKFDDNSKSDDLVLSTL